jgi:hypothetical protein
MHMLTLWPKILFAMFLGVLVPTYWRHYGPGNFLWFSDIALLMMGASLWLESSLLVSMAALAVLLLELLWAVDFFIGLIAKVSPTGLSGYMFDSKISLPIRALSLFHLVLPPLMLWLLSRLGYDNRALVFQTLLAWLVLPVSYFTTKPADNVNWVYGFRKRQTLMAAPLYLALLMILFPVVLYLPMHFLLKRIFQ